MFNVCLSQVHNREKEVLSCNTQQISGGGSISENRTVYGIIIIIFFIKISNTKLFIIL